MDFIDKQEKGLKEMALERQDVEMLTYPFPAAAHKFLNDMPYIHEEIVNDRLDLVDPSWTWQIVKIERRANAGEGGKDVGTVWAHVTLTVKGVSRDAIGMAVIQQTNPNPVKRWNDKTKQNEPTGDVYTSEANEAEKSATTDALKRAARMFGIGRYLLAIPKQNSKSTVTNTAQMEKWLKATFGDIQATKLTYEDNEETTPSPTPPNPLDPETHGLTKDIKTPRFQTKPIVNIEVRQEKPDGKPYIVAGGMTLFSRAPFRVLGYGKHFTEGDLKAGRLVFAEHEAFIIVYEKDGNKKKPVLIKRVSSGEEAEI